MDRYRIGTLLLAAAAVGVGAVYLYFGTASLAVVLPVMSLCFTALCVLTWRGGKAAGAKGVTLVLPVLASALVAGVALFATAAYFLL